jgi:Leucine-rich repeat (LRR) protein
MTDRYKLHLFIEKIEYFSPQEISEVYMTKNLRLSLGFGAHPGKKFKEQSIEDWISTFPRLKNVKRLLLMSPKSQAFFAAACKITQLQTLILNSLKVEDLTPIRNLKNLDRIHIDSCHQLRSISPIIDLKNINHLKIENCYNIENLELIGQMTWLKALCLTGDGTAPKRLRLNSLKPFRNLKQLKHLDLSTTSVIDKSYEILLNLPELERFDTTSNIKASLVHDIKSKHKKLKAGFFVDWDYVNNKIYDDKQW